MQSEGNVNAKLGHDTVGFRLELLGRNMQWLYNFSFLSCIPSGFLASWVPQQYQLNTDFYRETKDGKNGIVCDYYHEFLVGTFRWNGYEYHYSEIRKYCMFAVEYQKVVCCFPLVSCSFLLLEHTDA